MKKKIIALLAILLCVCFAACSKENLNETEDLNQAANNAEEENQAYGSEDETQNVTEKIEESAPVDERGIPGMKSFPIRMLLNNSFGIPYTEETAADQYEEPYFAASCMSDAASDDGVSYDYSLTMDSDDEIIQGTFGILATTASDTQLMLAADLYFYAVAINPYDTADEETLTEWVDANLATANENGSSTTVGDATFTLYRSGSMIWIEISKTSEE